MSDAETDQPRKKTGVKGLLVTLVLFTIAAGAGFFTVYSGMVMAPEGSKTATAHTDADLYEATHPAPTFVPLQPLMVTLGRGDTLEQLRFEGHLEVRPGTEETVTQLMPRVMDVLNGYLRAVEIGDLADPSSLMTLRAQMLRRIQIVIGDGIVTDLLISKFLLS